MRVGLTGGVASGKSTVALLLAELGARVIDSDLIAREVVEPGTPGLAALVEEFGPRVLAADGSLDRAALGSRVFADEPARRCLEGLLHPRIRARAAELEAAAPSGTVVVHDIPLLVESGQADAFDAVLVVDVPAEVQVERMVRLRGMSEADARARLRAQASREERRAVATHLLDNTGTAEDLRERVAEVFAELSSA